MLDHVTTAVQSPLSEASDPSGTAQLLVGAVAGLTLTGGVARVAVS